MHAVRAILIGGTSHVGKSTLARLLADALGWQQASTDRMARHPGRPWPEVRPHVAEHYLRLSDDAIYEFLRVHHGNMWPGVRRRITAATAGDAPGAAQAGTGLVFEGSALRPELIDQLEHPGLAAVWLVAPDALIAERIHSSSGYARADGATQRMVQRFVERSRRDNAAVKETARRLGLECVDVARTGAFDELHARLVQAVRRA